MAAIGQWLPFTKDFRPKAEIGVRLHPALSSIELLPGIGGDSSGFAEGSALLESDLASTAAYHLNKFIFGVLAEHEHRVLVVLNLGHYVV